MTSQRPPVAGLVLAAGAGRRMGRAKALVGDEHGPWLTRAVEALVDAGCAPVLVVLGAAPEAADLAGEARVVLAQGWAEGMSASLRAGLDALDDTDAEAVVLTLVDLPDVGADVVRRLLAGGVDTSTLTRAAYAGAPGHPVVLGRDHWVGVIATARGDRGARDYLREHSAVLIDCSDLATGVDVDRQ